MFRLFVPDNQEHWQVFKKDVHVVCFIKNIGEFDGNTLGLEDEMECCSLPNMVIMEGMILLEKKLEIEDELNYRVKHVAPPNCSLLFLIPRNILIQDVCQGQREPHLLLPPINAH